MRITVDTDARTLDVEDKGKRESLALYSKEAFDIVSREWINIGWAVKYVYSFLWLGRPIIQLPDDMIRIQEVVLRSSRTSSSRREWLMEITRLLCDALQSNGTRKGDRY